MHLPPNWIQNFIKKCHREVEGSSTQKCETMALRTNWWHNQICQESPKTQKIQKRKKRQGYMNVCAASLVGGPCCRSTLCAFALL